MTYLLANGIGGGGGVSGRENRDNGAVGNTETRDPVDGKARVDDTALLPGHHGGRAARVHE